MGVHGAQDHSVPNTIDIARLVGNSRLRDISSVHTRVVWIGAVSALEAGLSFCQSIRNDNNIMTMISTRTHPGVCIMVSSSKAMSVCLSSGAQALIGGDPGKQNAGLLKPGEQYFGMPGSFYGNAKRVEVRLKDLERLGFDCGLAKNCCIDCYVADKHGCVAFRRPQAGSLPRAVARERQWELTLFTK